MRDWVAVPYEPLSGFDIAVVSPARVVHRFESLEPNRSTELLDLEPGAWAVHNDSPYGASAINCCYPALISF